MRIGKSLSKDLITKNSYLMNLRTGEGDALKEILIPYLKEKGKQETDTRNTSLLIIIIVSILVVKLMFVFIPLFIAILLLSVIVLPCFLAALLSAIGHYDGDYTILHKIVKDSICSLYVLDEFKEIIIEFGIYPGQFVKLPEKNKEKISEIFRIFNSTRTDYDIFVSFSPLIKKVTQTHEMTPFDELLKIVDEEVNKAAANLPKDLKAKGVEMSKAYLYVYCVENTLRLFIHQKSELKHGSSYINHIVINYKVRKKVQERKDEEAKSKFLTPRGNNDLFYMDFKELGDVIIGNPDLLSPFPNEIWLKAKIEELGNIRNLIAHNNLIGEHEINILKANYQSILRQIGSV